MKCSPEEFVKVWQESASVNEVCQRTGMEKLQVINRAVHYRRRGIPLKHFNHSTKAIDVAALTALANKHAK